MATWIEIHNGRGKRENNPLIIPVISQIFVICIFLSFEIKAQDFFELSVEKNSLYKDVLAEVESRYQIHFSYPAEIGVKKVQENVVLNDVSVRSMVKKLLFHLQLDFIFQGNEDILIRPLPVYPGDEWLWLQVTLREVQSNEPIPFILVHTANMEHAEYTDESGWCGLKIPKKSFDGTLNLYSFNYTPITVQVDKKSSRHEFTMQLQTNKLPPIICTGKRKSYLFDGEEGIITRFSEAYQKPKLSVFGNDPIQSVQMLAGVLAHDDKNTALKIRGSSEEAVLLTIEETPVYKIDHLLGVFSILNGEYYNAWKLYKNYIPVKYGGKTGGMLDVSSEKQREKTGGSLNLNFLYTSLVMQLVPSDNFGVQVGFRHSFETELTSTLTDFSSRESLLNQPAGRSRNRNLLVNQPDFRFYDGQWKTWLVLDKKHKLTFHGFLSDDKMDNTYRTMFRTPLFFVSENQVQNKEWNNLSSGVNYGYTGKKEKLDVHVYTTKFTEKSSLDYSISRKNLSINRQDSFVTANENFIHDRGVKAVWSQNKEAAWQVGGEWVYHDNILFFEENKTPVFEVNRTEQIGSGFVSKRWALSAFLSLQTDIRVSYIKNLDDVWVLPQLFLEWKKNQSRLQLGTSRYKQAVRMMEFENFFGQRTTFFVLANGSSIPVSEAYNTFLAWQYKKNIFTVQAEAYYRKTFGNLFLGRNVATLLDRNSAITLADFRLFQGEGRFYGIDLGLVMNWKNWQQSFQYSLSKAENRFDNLFNGEYIYAVDDSRHQCKITEFYQFNKWHFQTSLIYASGRPYTNVNEILAEKENVDIQDIQSGLYQDRLPDYIRWDGAIGYTIDISDHARCVLAFSCYNITNRINVKYRQFFFQLPNQNNGNAVLGNDVTLLGRTFNLSASFSFY